MKRMKRFKKLASMVLAVAMVLTMALPVMAAGANKKITITSSPTVDVTETTFKAYKILDAVDVGADGQIAYTVPDNMKPFFNKWCRLTGNEPDYSVRVVEWVRAQENDMYTFGEMLGEAVEEGNIPAEGTGSVVDNNYEISGLDVGYYLVLDDATGKAASQVILRTTDTEVSVVVKADVPTIDKSIVGSEDGTDTDGDPSTSGNVSTNNEAVGDLVPYELKTKVPAMSNFEHYRFVISDNLSKGLTYQGDLTIKIGSQTLTPSENGRDGDYTVTSANRSDGGTDIRIVFHNFIKWKNQAGADIVLRYSAKLNEDAVIGTAGNPNTVKLLYSNDRSQENYGTPGDDFGPDDVQGETEDITVRTYVTGLQLDKVNASGNELKGATFTLSGNRINRVNQKGAQFKPDSNGEYWKLKDGTYTKQAPVQNKTDHLYEEDGQKYVKEPVPNWIDTSENVTAEVSVNDDGILVFEGLAAGKYEIKEIKAPNGYNLLKETIYVTIECNNGNQDGNAPCSWSGEYKIGDGEVKPLNFNTDNGIIDGLNVVNNTGTELPSTGGIGTTLFYIIGGILVVGAAILLVTKKRMSKEA